MQMVEERDGLPGVDVVAVDVGKILAKHTESTESLFLSETD
jgi:hypothetical protein